MASLYGSTSNYQIVVTVCTILAFIPAIILHEVAHGFIAYKLGDTTAKSQGRLSLNPLRHVDPFGTVILPIMLLFVGGPVFGYAKPVPYNPSNFKNKRQGELLVGLAGPLANLVMALIGAVIFSIMGSALGTVGNSINSATMVYYTIYAVFLPQFILINLYLMFFNLIPIPPLDGSSIIGFLLPERFLLQYYKVQQYALPIFLIILFVVPYFLQVDIIGWYLKATAGNLGALLMSF